MSAQTAEKGADYRPQHCPTCNCEPVGPLPAGVPVDPYCPEHGSRPTAYDDCSCLGRVTSPGSAGDVRSCRVCGCTDDHACPPMCSWVEADLCSACAPAPT